MKFKFKTKPFEQQRTALRRLSPDDPAKAREFYGLLMEQGTGKSKTGIDWVGMLYETGQIDSVVVVAPNGVHDAWVIGQIPEHCAVPFSAYSWSSTGVISKRGKKEFAEFCATADELAIMTINAEALAFESGREAVTQFMKGRRTAVIIDEVDMFKNSRSKRTKWALKKLRRIAAFRMIMSGTIGSETPFDLWAPFNFLHPSILGDSFATFRAEYAKMLPTWDPLMKSIAKSLPKGRPLPDIVAKDADGRPAYRNLDRLQAKIKEHSFRVLKEDCLDLPPKLYVRRYVELTHEQRRIYNDAIRTMRIEWDDKMTLLTKLTLLLRLQQIIGGFLPDETPIFAKPEDNPKLAALLSDLEHQGNRQAIIWAAFVPEIKMIADVLGKRAAAYYGGTSGKDRTTIRKAYQAGDLQYFVGNPTVGGVGLNELVGATYAHYFSNAYSLRIRLQSEDRSHRIGTVSITYFDYEAMNSNDRRIINLLKGKRATAELVTGDFRKEDWLNEI